jgi:hypothetical protein
MVQTRAKSYNGDEEKEKIIEYVAENQNVEFAQVEKARQELLAIALWYESYANGFTKNGFDYWMKSNSKFAEILRKVDEITYDSVADVVRKLPIKKEIREEIINSENNTAWVKRFRELEEESELEENSYLEQQFPDQTPVVQNFYGNRHDNTVELKTPSDYGRVNQVQSIGRETEFAARFDWLKYKNHPYQSKSVADRIEETEKIRKKLSFGINERSDNNGMIPQSTGYPNIQATSNATLQSHSMSYPQRTGDAMPQSRQDQTSLKPNDSGPQYYGEKRVNVISTIQPPNNQDADKSRCPSPPESKRSKSTSRSKSSKTRSPSRSRSSKSKSRKSRERSKSRSHKSKSRKSRHRSRYSSSSSNSSSSSSSSRSSSSESSSSNSSSSSRSYSSYSSEDSHRRRHRRHRRKTDLNQLAEALSRGNQSTVAIENLKNDKQDTEEWFKYFERVAIGNGWSKEAMGAKISLYLKGDAEHYWKQMRKSKQYSYSRVKKHLIRRLRNEDRDMEASKKFYAASQTDTESVQEFARRLAKYAKHAGSISSKHKIKRMRQGMNQNIAIAVATVDTKSFSEFVSKCKDAEKHLKYDNSIDINAVTRGMRDLNKNNNNYKDNYQQQKSAPNYAQQQQQYYHYQQYITGSPQSQQQLTQQQIPYQQQQQQQYSYQQSDKRQQQQQAYSHGQDQQTARGGCFDCGANDHYRKDCPNFRYRPNGNPPRCNRCKGVGHIEKNCRAKF